MGVGGCVWVDVCVLCVCVGGVLGGGGWLGLCVCLCMLTSLCTQQLGRNVKTFIDWSKSKQS